MEKKLIVAIDGYSSTGKSTVAKKIAALLGYTYIDTGAMYRAVTLAALRGGLISSEGNVSEELRRVIDTINVTFLYNAGMNRSEVCLNGESVENEIRSLRVAEHVSQVASLGYVRHRLVAMQRIIGQNGNVIMDGRDIGSVVFPSADIKFFMTASPEVRARRRFEELKAKGEKVTYEEIEENVRKRDFMDENRSESPLRRTNDAILVDNSNMTLDEEVEMMVKIINEKHHAC